MIGVEWLVLQWWHVPAIVLALAGCVVGVVSWDRYRGRR